MSSSGSATSNVPEAVSAETGLASISLPLKVPARAGLSGGPVRRASTLAPPLRARPVNGSRMAKSPSEALNVRSDVPAPARATEPAAVTLRFGPAATRRATDMVPCAIDI
jgi:hypothetical protein